MRFEASAFLRARASPPCAPRSRIHRVRRRQTDRRTRVHGEGGGVGGGGQGLAGRGRGITETDDPHGCIDISHG